MQLRRYERFTVTVRADNDIFNEVPADSQRVICTEHENLNVDDVTNDTVVSGVVLCHVPFLLIFIESFENRTDFNRAAAADLKFVIGYPASLIERALGALTDNRNPRVHTMLHIM
ncbi:hypothetical protein D3C87_1497540 [compost metagenome]